MSDKRTKNSERIHRPDERDRSSRVAPRARAVERVAGTAFPRFVRSLTVAFGVIAGAAAPSLAPAADQTPAAFISTIGNDALAEMRSTASLDHKLAYFGRMLSQDFDLDGMSRFVLGPIGAPQARSSSKSSGLSWKNTSCSPTVGALQRLAAANSASPAVEPTRTELFS
jgi:hypothetical protein